ncbi:MAG TPA: TIGR02530 family flagellar biosynthesis protein [Desulfuromonadales bacterium]|nr:TIGR02530 family flagellar biosynthesis protein [Desulfuromonadales bacterium]
MDDRLLILPKPIAPAGTTQGGKPGASKQTPAVPFDQVLDTQLQKEPLKFSRHAALRMESRGISFNTTDMNRIKNAVDQVGAKGGKDSLVLLDQTALVVSVKNNTVVTVMDKDTLKGNVFTNIDSAIIA